MAKTTSSKSKKVALAKKSRPSAKKQSMKDRILHAIACQHALGKESVDKTLVINLCTVTNRHTFDTTCAAMKKTQLIEYVDSGQMKLTQQGLELAGDAAKPPENNDAAQEMLKEKLAVSKSKEMFDVLADGRAYSRAEIASAVGMDVNAKTFKTYISYLSKLVEKVDGGKIRLMDIAFPCGRPCDI